MSDLTNERIAELLVFVRERVATHRAKAEKLSTGPLLTEDGTAEIMHFTVYEAGQIRYLDADDVRLERLAQETAEADRYDDIAHSLAEVERRRAQDLARTGHERGDGHV